MRGTSQVLYTTIALKEKFILWIVCVGYPWDGPLERTCCAHVTSPTFIRRIIISLRFHPTCHNCVSLLSGRKMMLNWKLRRVFWDSEIPELFPRQKVTLDNVRERSQGHRDDISVGNLPSYETPITKRTFWFPRLQPEHSKYPQVLRYDAVTR
jgi:hypothetical protein